VHLNVSAQPINSHQYWGLKICKWFLFSVNTWILDWIITVAIISTPHGRTRSHFKCPDLSLVWRLHFTIAVTNKYICLNFVFHDDTCIFICTKYSCTSHHIKFNYMHAFILLYYLTRVCASIYTYIYSLSFSNLVIITILALMMFTTESHSWMCALKMKMQFNKILFLVFTWPCT